MKTEIQIEWKGKKILPDQDLGWEDDILKNTPSQGEDELPLRRPEETLYEYARKNGLL